MKLYKVPNNTYVRALKDEKAPPESRSVKEAEVVMFHHIDGMYSYCHDSQGNVVHLPAWAEVEIVKNVNIPPS